MRGVGVGHALKIVLAGALALAAAPMSGAFAADTETARPRGEDDYYTRRARTIIEAEKAAEVKPHPLADSYPGMDVVVCEAGCVDRGPHVVFLRPSAASSSEGLMVPTSMSDEGDPLSQAVACVAGCYDDTAVEVPAPAAAAAAPARTWSTTVTPRDPIDEKLSPLRR